MAFEDAVLILDDAENALIKRHNATTDEDEKEVLTAKIQNIRDMRDFGAFDSLQESANTLNDLADVMEAAAGALRRQPFDSIFGAYQSIFDRIGAVIGNLVGLKKPALAPNAAVKPSPTPPPAAPRSAAPPAAAGSDAPAKLAAMYATCKVDPARISEVDHFYVRRIVKNRAQYEAVGEELGIPWWFIGVVHGLEASFSLQTHLHNGDPLTARTVLVPAGRPEHGSPPFTWRGSALDAMRFKRFDGLADWSIGAALDRLERYNGLGYRNLELPSPYLWGFSQHFTKGKFIADHLFDPEATTGQCGGATLLRRLEDRDLFDTTRPLDSAAGAVSAADLATNATVGVAAPIGAGVPPLPASMRKWAKAELDFPGNISEGAKDSGAKRLVRRVQEWCSFHKKMQTPIDGDFGPGTKAAVEGFQLWKGLAPTGSVDERTWAALTQPMRSALAPVPVVPGETIYDLVLKVARQHLSVHPVEFQVKGEGNCGPWVRLYMHGKEGDKQPWCAGFVCHVIAQAAHALDRAMPIKRQVGVDALVADADADGRFLLGSKLDAGTKRTDKIRPGSLFVNRKTASDWTHVGIVTTVSADVFTTIEGNSDVNGSREGIEVCTQSRSYTKRDFVLLV
jgi:lysozyme family protein